MGSKLPGYTAIFGIHLQGCAHDNFAREHLQPFLRPLRPLQWHGQMRRTKIICTIGPSTESAEMLEKMIAAGMDVARLNMSHANHDWTRTSVDRIRAASEKVGRTCAIL